MTDRDIIIRLATEVMGWNVHQVVEFGEWYGTKPTDKSPCWHIWNPLESWGDVMELQGSLPICRRHSYLRELCYITDAFMDGIGSTALHERDWKLLSATPRQRCMAMIAVLYATRISGDSAEKTTEYKPKTP